MSSLKCNCIYLITHNIEISANFYCQLLNTKIDRRFEDRWVQIKTANNFTVGLLNINYDIKKISSGVDVENHYDENFIKNLQKNFTVGNTVVINFISSDFQKDYDRIKKMWPDKVSPTQYVNYMFPYNFFVIKDPDGHVIEIADS